MERKFWRYFAYGYLAVNTVSIIMLIETIILGKPYVSLFLLILAATVYMNLKTFGKSGLPDGQRLSKSPQPLHQGIE